LLRPDLTKVKVRRKCTFKLASRTPSAPAFALVRRGLQRFARPNSSPGAPGSPPSAATGQSVRYGQAHRQSDLKQLLGAHRPQPVGSDAPDSMCGLDSTIFASGNLNASAFDTKGRQGLGVCGGFHKDRRDNHRRVAAYSNKLIRSKSDSARDSHGVRAALAVWPAAVPSRRLPQFSFLLLVSAFFPRKVDFGS
jgi:hypothetical protein